MQGFAFVELSTDLAPVGFVFEVGEQETNPLLGAESIVDLTFGETVPEGLRPREYAVLCSRRVRDVHDVLKGVTRFDGGSAKFSLPLHCDSKNLKAHPHSVWVSLQILRKGGDG